MERRHELQCRSGFRSQSSCPQGPLAQTYTDLKPKSRRGEWNRNILGPRIAERIDPELSAKRWYARMQSSLSETPRNVVFGEGNPENPPPLVNSRAEGPGQNEDATGKAVCRTRGLAARPGPARKQADKEARLYSANGSQVAQAPCITRMAARATVRSVHAEQY